MKASELIAELAALIRDCGDRHVVFNDPNYGFVYIASVRTSDLGGDFVLEEARP